jgi:predicted ATPase/DNA-binding CsgD family transcriptional regulator
VPNASAAPLFGRTGELAQLRHLLSDSNVRLLTLTGPGGTGKTRLAQAFVSDATALPGRAVWFVDLSVVDDPAHVASSIAQALNVQESGSEPLPAILRDVLNRTAALLVLDNFERVMGAADLLADLLAAAPDLTCLVTSREPLHLRAEQVFPVGPLPVPGIDVSDLSSIVASPSVALFQDRGRARLPDFAITSVNAPEVAEICRRLDGLPLAIELAAAQIGVLSPQAVLERLEAREPFVFGGARDAPARHRTLRAAVAWSYELLDPVEQLVFRQCGVFSGTFGTAAVAGVVEHAGQSQDRLSTVARLADKNLIQVVNPMVGDPRFRLIETIRAFAITLLTETGELAASRRRHAGYFLEFAEHAEKTLLGPTMADTLDRLEREYDNLRAALYWALEGGDLLVGLRLAGALYRFWMLRGHLAEARQWLSRALPRSLDQPVTARAKALNAAGVLAGVQGDNAAAETFFQESLRLWETVGDPIRLAAAMGNLGLTAQDRQDAARAMDCFLKAESLYASVGDQRGIAVSMGSRAHLARQQGKTLEAVNLLQEALALFRLVGDPRGTANALANLGHALLELRKPEESIGHFRESLELRRKLGNTLGIAECLEGFAAAAAATRRAGRAARLLGAAAALREVTGAPLPATDRERYEDVVRRIHAQLDPQDFERQHAIGGGLGAEQAVAYALRESDEPSPGQHGLTGRERQIALLVARGLTNQQIARSLLVTRRTVSSHLEHIFAKLDVQTRAEVAVWITRHVDPPGR